MSDSLLGGRTPRPINTFIMGHHRYQVIGPVFVARSLSGGDAYVYRDGLVPPDTNPAQIAQALDQGLIREIEGIA